MVHSLSFFINIVVTYWMFGKVMSAGCYSTDMRDRGEEEMEGKGKREGREKDRKTGRKEGKEN